MYRRNNINNLFNTLEKKELKKESEEKESDDSIELINDKLLKTKNDKRIKLLNDFLDSYTKYDTDEFALLSDIRKKFKRYCYDLDKNNFNNIVYSLTKEDIINYNDKFKIKYFSFCRSCQKRYHYGCCSENNRFNRGSKEIILYMKLKN